MAMSETDLSRAIHQTLKGFGYIVVRVQSGKVRMLAGKREYWVQLAEKGCPDRVVLGPGGVTTWLEIKTPNGKLNPDQRAWHARAAEKGHRVATVRSVMEALMAVGHRVQQKLIVTSE